jgi:hypothetical protein
MDVLRQMSTTIQYWRSEGVRVTFGIAILTDGVDNQSDKHNVRAEDVKAVVQELRAKKYLKKSLVIGIDNPALTCDKMTAIQQALGFDEAIPVGQSAKGIREAFELWSKSIMDMEKAGS